MIYAKSIQPMNQLGFRFRRRGGKRKGAGRKPKGDSAGVSHLARERFSRREPVHVTLRLKAGVGYLRAYSRMNAILLALAEAQERFGLRIVDFSVQGSHLHLIVEAEGPGNLTRGIQGLSVRLARRLNRLSRRRGKAFADRFHSHVLKTRRETRNALRYVRENYRHHVREPEQGATDPCAGRLVEPRTWLLQHAEDG